MTLSAAHDEPETVTESPMVYRLEGMRAMLHFMVDARTIGALRLKVEAARYVVSRDNATITATARRLGVSRRQFHRVLKEIRSVTGLQR